MDYKFQQCRNFGFLINFEFNFYTLISLFLFIHVIHLIWHITKRISIINFHYQHIFHTLSCFTESDTFHSLVYLEIIPILIKRILLKLSFYVSGSESFLMNVVIEIGYNYKMLYIKWSYSHELIACLFLSVDVCYMSFLWPSCVLWHPVVRRLLDTSYKNHAINSSYTIFQISKFLTQFQEVSGW